MASANNIFTEYFADLDRIIEDLMMKLQKDLEVDERITAEAEKTFFTTQDQFQVPG